MRKADIAIIAAVLITAAVFLILLFSKKKGEMAVLYIDEKEMGRYPLSEDQRIFLEAEEGYNVIVIVDGKVSVAEADCGNQICVHTPAISREGETIVCLPHRFFVAVENR